MIDGSPTLLLACLRAFNCETVPEYLNRCFRIVTGSASEYDFKKTMLHTCASHFMKNASKICRKYYKHHFRDAMYWIGLLLQSTNLKVIDSIVESITIITHSDFTTDLVKKHYEKLKSQIEQVDYDSLSDDFYGQQDEDEDELSDFASGEEKKICQLDITQDECVAKAISSPFRAHFHSIVENAIRTLKKYNSAVRDLR